MKFNLSLLRKLQRFAADSAATPAERATAESKIESMLAVETGSPALSDLKPIMCEHCNHPFMTDGTSRTCDDCLMSALRMPWAVRSAAQNDGEFERVATIISRGMPGTRHQVQETTKEIKE